ncbi:MAG: hypothetical protein J7K34_09440 [Flavobacteriaceae bacterium]|nr:hypothetical protein [Flavobacteriaceae bacterium]
MGKNKIIQLNRDNYSELLNEFLEKFSKDFPVDYNTWEKLDFTIEVWNITNIKKFVPEDLFSESARLSEDMEDTGQLFNKMIDYKLKYYIDYDKFIVDYNFDFEDEPPRFEVTVGDMNAYIKAIEERELEEEGNLINRHAIILKPKKLFENWMENLLDKDFDDNIYGAKIYMIDDDIFELEDWVAENFDDLFVRELEVVILNKDKWPKNRTYSMFKKWFKIDFSTMVYDLDNSEELKNVLE